MHTYAGINALTLTGTASANGTLPATLTANTGVWSTGQVADGGDPRSAANLFVAVEAAIDRSNFLAWRNINIVEGGAYTWTSAISLANQFGWNGNHAFNAGVGFNAGVTFNGATATTFNTNVQLAGTSATVEAGTNLDVANGATQTFESGSKILGAPYFYGITSTFNSGAALTPAIIVNGGTINVTSTPPNPTDDPGGLGVYTSSNATKFKAHLTITPVTPSTAFSVTLDDGYNVSAAHPPVQQTGFLNLIAIKFQRPMANAYYVVSPSFECATATSGSAFVVSGKSTTGFSLLVAGYDLTVSTGIAIGITVV